MDRAVISRLFPEGLLKGAVQPLVDKRMSDLQWQIIHGAISTNRYRAHLDPSVGEGCVFCNRSETIEHLFIHCQPLTPLFCCLETWHQGLGEDFSLPTFIFGPTFNPRKKTVPALINFIFASAKLAIWVSRRNQTEGSGCGDALLLLEGLLIARLRIEQPYYKLVDNPQAFCRIWTSGRVLCSVGEERELVLSF